MVKIRVAIVSMTADPGKASPTLVDRAVPSPAQSHEIQPANDSFSVMGSPHHCAEVPSASALALHTSSSELGLAIVDDAGAMRWQTWNLGRELSTQLHRCLQEFLYPHSWNQLAWLAVACGPGSFTSTRMGMVVARTLAQQLDIPLFAISSLAAIAWEHRHTAPSNTDLAVQMPAQRNEVYGAIYRLTVIEQSLPSLQPVLLDVAMPLAEWEDVRSAWKHPHHLVIAEDTLGKSVTSVLELAQLARQQGLRPHWSTAIPFYGQHPVR